MTHESHSVVVFFNIMVLTLKYFCSVLVLSIHFSTLAKCGGLGEEGEGEKKGEGWTQHSHHEPHTRQLNNWRHVVSLWKYNQDSICVTFYNVLSSSRVVFWIWTEYRLHQTTQVLWYCVQPPFCNSDISKNRPLAELKFTLQKLSISSVAVLHCCIREPHPIWIFAANVDVILQAFLTTAESPKHFHF